MALEQQIDQDLKTALLNGEKLKVETLRGLKSVFLYAKVAAGTRGTDFTDEQLIPMLAKEAKKRQESIELYLQAGDGARAEKEQTEKAIIEDYLPKQLSEEELTLIVNEVMAQMNAGGMSAMGKIIAEVKQQTQGAADGALIAKLVKERLSS